MRRRSLLIAFPLLGILALVAFARTPQEPINLTKASWTLTRLLVDGQEQPLVTGRVPTLQFRPQDGIIAGSAGCNSYGVAYSLQGERLHLSEGSQYQTLVMCTNAEVMQQEDTYMSALLRVARVQVTGATLTLSSDDGKVQLTFEAR